MNEHEPSAKQLGPHLRHSPSLEALEITSDNQTVVERWEEGITRWGYAFMAFTRLRTPALYTEDVLTAFQDCFISSYPSIEEFIQDQLEGLGWAPGLRKFMAEEHIPHDVLHWSYDAMEVHARQVCDLIKEGGRVYAFAR